jgi:hypothetical protein
VLQSVSDIYIFYVSLLVQSNVSDKMTQFHLIHIYIYIERERERERERARDCVLKPGLWIAHEKYDKKLWAVIAAALGREEGRRTLPKAPDYSKHTPNPSFWIWPNPLREMLRIPRPKKTEGSV